MKKVKQYVRKKKRYTNQWHLTPKFTLDIGFTQEPVVPYDILVVENTFVGDWK